MNCVTQKLRCWSSLVLSGVLLCSATARSGELSTNAPVRWVPLAELLKRWSDVPLDQVQREAERGELTAQHYLGYCYGEGVRVPVDGKKAVAWYERAGAGGYLPSFSNLGFLFQRGQGVPRDYERMLHYYRLSADAGYSGAQFNLGVVYRDGIGVSSDPIEAMKWFQREGVVSESRRSRR